jgi:hypothetical protein
MGVNYGGAALRNYYKGTDRVAVADMAVDASGATGGSVPLAGLVFQQLNTHYYCGGRLGIGETTPNQQLVVKGTSAIDGSAPVTIEINDAQTGVGNWSTNAKFGAIDFRTADGSVVGAVVRAQLAAFMPISHGGATSVRISVSNSTQFDQSFVFENTGRFTPGADNTQALGWSSQRWSIVYAGTGTINTSDARDKQWRGDMTTAELAAAKRIAAELGFYKWLAVIEAKGEAAARLHFGARAQEVWLIMADEGLVDPLDGDGRPGSTPYAFLCWDEWESEEGEQVSRFGLRLDQLALFLIAAQEQRIALLEAAGS